MFSHFPCEHSTSGQETRWAVRGVLGYANKGFFFHIEQLKEVILEHVPLKLPSRQPAVCCCVVAAAYTNKGGRPGLPDWGFKSLKALAS